VTATVLRPRSRATGTQTPDCRECSVGELPGTPSIGNHPSVTLDSATLAASPEAAARPGGLNRVLVGAAVGLAVVSICCCLIVVPWHRWLAARADINPLSWIDLLVAIVWPIVGALVVRSQPRNIVGWLMVVPALLGPYLLLAHYAMTSALLGHSSLPATTFATWLAVWGFAPYFFSVPLVALFFPDGRLQSRRWRPIVATLLVIAVITIAAAMVIPVGLDFAEQVPNPFGLAGFEWLRHLTKAGSSIVFFAGTALGLISVLLRLRGAVGVVRAQLQWLLLGALIAVLGAVLGPDLTELPILSELAAALGMLGPPLGIGIAMLRHRLFDVELVLSRTIVYTLLTILIAGVYAAAVFGVQFIAAGSPLAVVLIAAVALLAATTRSAVQRVVDRVLFGHRHNPHAVVSRVGRHTAAASEPAEALQRLVDSLREVLRLPYVAFHAADDALVADSGHPVAGWREVPAMALGNLVGNLHVGLRRAGERWSTEEQSAIEEVASRAGTLAFAGGLVAEVARSRERIVIAREEERRRLRADLHDGVGPALAGTAHQIDALARRLDGAGHPALAGRARELRDRLRQTVADVRSVVHGLRPPILDQLGLTAALRELGQGYDAPQCTISVEELGELPAAVEVAAYAIAGEAVANAVRHSAASRLVISASRGKDTVSIEVVDNGCGLPSRPRAGVGLRSMTERAHEVGGRLDIRSNGTDGTAVRAVLPLGQP
jgi:signal transduction histidine kinase